MIVRPIGRNSVKIGECSVGFYRHYVARIGDLIIDSHTGISGMTIFEYEEMLMRVNSGLVRLQPYTPIGGKFVD
jgi:hypothetical protein